MPTTYAIPNGKLFMDVLTWSGTGGSSGATRNITGLKFQPDFVWEKSRTSGSNHQLMNSVVGAGSGKVLSSNSVGSEPTPAVSPESSYGWLSSFNTDGFTLTNGTSTFDNYNKSGDTYVAWNFKAGGTTVTNTAGTITSQVNANTTAGFSIVTWTGNGVISATVGHGLNAIPALIICKERNGGDYWHVKHQSTASNTNLYLNVTNASTSAASVGDGILSDLNSSTTFGFATAGSPGNVVAVNENGLLNIAYCWAEINGYSKFGTWINNNSTDGTFVYLGFKPRFILFKNTDNVECWYVWDSARQNYNVAAPSNNWINPNATYVEQANNANTAAIDGLSNGFKIRTTNPAAGEVSFGTRTYAYAAFAENPFKYANAY